MPRMTRKEEKKRSRGMINPMETARRTARLMWPMARVPE